MVTLANANPMKTAITDIMINMLEAAGAAEAVTVAVAVTTAPKEAIKVTNAMLFISNRHALIT